MVFIISVAAFVVVLASLLAIVDWLGRPVERRVDYLEGVVLRHERIR